MRQVLESEAMMISHPVTGFVALICAGCLSGCAPMLEPGSIAVEIRSTAPDAQGDRYQVRVVQSDGTLIFSQDMSAGSSLSYGDVPLGWVSISADSQCKVEAELTIEQPSMGLIVDGTNCTLADGEDLRPSP
jgi:hypothetical protein